MRLWRRKKITCCFPTYQTIKIPFLLRAAHTNRQPTWKWWRMGVDASWWPSKRFVQGTKILRPTWLWVSCMIYIISNWKKIGFPEITFNFDLSPYSLHSGTITLYVTWWYTGYQGLRPQQSLGDNSIDFPLIFDGIEENYKIYFLFQIICSNIYPNIWT